MLQTPTFLPIISSYSQRFPVGVEVFLERLPALVIIMVHSLTGLIPPLGHCQTQRGLKHEGLQPGITSTEFHSDFSFEVSF